MDLPSAKNTYHSNILNTPEVDGTEYLIKQHDAKPGPSHILRPEKYLKKELTAENNRHIVLIHENHEDSSYITPKKPCKKRLLPVLQKYEFFTNIDSDESSSKFFSFGPKSTATDNNEIYQPCLYTKQDIHNPQRAEKTTYCRPVLNLYNQEFIYKTMQRNARLQKLAKRLVDAREKEKQNEAWNNYINKLRNKHRYADVSHIPNYVQDENPEIIDYYNTKFSWQQSNPCQNLLNDFYDTPNENCFNDYVQRLNNYKTPEEMNLNDYGQRLRPAKYSTNIFENNKYCYPTSSQGRLLALNRERLNNRYKTWEYHNPNYHRNTIMGKHSELPSNKPSYIRTPTTKRQYLINKKVDTNIIRSLAVQTDLMNVLNNETDERSKQALKEKYDLVSSNVIRQKIMQSMSSEQISPLSKIENKIDVLINSVNNFLSEVKSKKCLMTVSKSRAVSCNSFESNKTSSPNNNHLKFLKDHIMCGVLHENVPNSMGLYENNRDTIEDILFEEINKSDQVKQDIEEILTKSDHSCSVHIEFDIPTKERSTEVTDSFSKTMYNPKGKFEVLAPKDDRKMTIAVNTDPLGLLALIRVSGDTLKKLLSFMPQIDYYSYLSKLQFSQATTISSFVCNICGAAFSKASQLSSHIQDHNLGKSRDCCVCRHLHMNQRRSALFKCRHCGQVFTRAYCKELHEQDCGRRLGRLDDRTPNLVMLT